jgi:hypothetical protein
MLHAPQYLHDIVIHAHGDAEHPLLEPSERRYRAAQAFLKRLSEIETPAQQTAITLVHVSDPGHGWLILSARRVAELGIASLISPYSYQRGDQVYLEEDVDAGLALEALRVSGYDVRLIERYDERGWVRSLPAYNAIA